MRSQKGTSGTRDTIFRILDSLSPRIPTVSDTEARNDQAATDDEAAFSRRFGVDWPRHLRIQLIELKQSRGFTDRELRVLLRSGWIRRGDGVLRTCPNRWMSVFGNVQLFVIFFLAAWLVVALILRTPLALNLLLEAAVGLGLATATFMATYRYYVEPGKIWRENRRELATQTDGDAPSTISVVSPRRGADRI